MPQLKFHSIQDGEPQYELQIHEEEMRTKEVSAETTNRVIVHQNRLYDN